MTVSISSSTLQIILGVISVLCFLWMIYIIQFLCPPDKAKGKKSIAVAIFAACVLSIGYIESKKHQYQVDQLPPMWRELYRQVDKVPRELRDKFVADAVTKHHFPQCSREELRLITWLGDISFSHFERFVNDNPEFTLENLGDRK